MQPEVSGKDVGPIHLAHQSDLDLTWHIRKMKHPVLIFVTVLALYFSKGAVLAILLYFDTRPFHTPINNITNSDLEGIHDTYKI